MKWDLPPTVKYFEALGAVGDGRVQVIDCHKGFVQSSSGRKVYQINYDPQSNIIYSNDNGSYWRGYLGYPAIAFLMVIGELRYSSSLAASLTGIRWKDLNRQNNNDYAVVEQLAVDKIDKIVAVPPYDVAKEIDDLRDHLTQMSLRKPAHLLRPPVGY